MPPKSIPLPTKSKLRAPSSSRLPAVAEPSTSASSASSFSLGGVGAPSSLGSPPGLPPPGLGTTTQIQKLAGSSTVGRAVTGSTGSHTGLANHGQAKTSLQKSAPGAKSGVKSGPTPVLKKDGRTTINSKGDRSGESLPDSSVKTTAPVKQLSDAEKNKLKVAEAAIAKADKFIAETLLMRRYMKDKRILKNYRKMSADVKAIWRERTGAPYDVERVNIATTHRPLLNVIHASAQKHSHTINWRSWQSICTLGLIDIDGALELANKVLNGQDMTKATSDAQRRYNSTKKKYNKLTYKDLEGKDDGIYSDGEETVDNGSAQATNSGEILKETNASHDQPNLKHSHCQKLKASDVLTETNSGPVEAQGAVVQIETGASKCVDAVTTEFDKSLLHSATIYCEAERINEIKSAMDSDERRVVFMPMNSETCNKLDEEGRRYATVIMQYPTGIYEVFAGFVVGRDTTTESFSIAHFLLNAGLTNTTEGAVHILFADLANHFNYRYSMCLIEKKSLIYRALTKTQFLGEKFARFG